MRRLLPFLPALAVAFLAIAAGLPALDYAFVYDDQRVVVERAPWWVEGLGKFLTTRHWGTGRHAALFSLDLDRLWLSGAPAAFHATNLALAGLVSVLVLALARRCGLGTLGAACAAAVFAVHPTHVDAVVSIVGRAELLAALGVLVVLLAAFDGKARSNLVVFSVSAAGALLAFHSKESALCLPGLLAAAALAFPRRLALAPALAGVAAALVVWTAHVLPLAREITLAQYVDNPLAYDSVLERFPKAMEVLARYASLVVWPHPLLADRSFAQTNPSMALGWTATAGWLAGLSMLAWKRRQAPLLFFGVLWFPVAFAVTSNVAFATGTVMAERLLYLPSVGPCLLIGLLAERLAASPRPPMRLVYAAAGAAVLIVFMAQFRARGAVWESAEIYFPASAALSPNSAKAWYDLGQALSRMGRHAEAHAAFERALSIHPPFSRASYLLAEGKAAHGDPAAGIAVYERYLQVMPDDDGALTNVIRLLLQAGRPLEAQAYAQRLVALKPESAAARNTLLTVEAAVQQAERRKLRTAPVNP